MFDLICCWLWSARASEGEIKVSQQILQASNACTIIFCLRSIQKRQHRDKVREIDTKVRETNVCAAVDEHLTYYVQIIKKCQS